MARRIANSEELFFSTSSVICMVAPSASGVAILPPSYIVRRMKSHSARISNPCREAQAAPKGAQRRERTKNRRVSGEGELLAAPVRSLNPAAEDDVDGVELML